MTLNNSGYMRLPVALFIIGLAGTALAAWILMCRCALRRCERYRRYTTMSCPYEYYIEVPNGGRSRGHTNGRCCAIFTAVVFLVALIMFVCQVEPTCVQSPRARTVYALLTRVAHCAPARSENFYAAVLMLLRIT